MAILDIKNVCKSFGGLMVIDDLSLTVEPGELRCVIGPNGAGKTTLFGLISGALRPDSGRITFDGRVLNELSISQISRLGIGRKFQAPTIFENLTVLENLQVAAQAGQGLRQLAFSSGPRSDGVVGDLLEVIELGPKRHLAALALAHGEKQWLEIGMVLASRPKLLLLDEPTAGMTPAETHQTAELIRRISRQTTTIVIEHDLKFIREIGQIVTVLYYGAVLAQGTLDAISADEQVHRAYLGSKVL